MPLTLAAVGLAGLLAWYGHALLIDYRLLGPFWTQTTAGGIHLFLLLRIGLLPVIVILGLLTLIAAARGKSSAPWFFCVAFLLLAPLVVERLPTRPTLVPYYLLFLFYVASGLAIRRRAALGRTTAGSVPEGRSPLREE